ncbi:MAG: endonuclease/exonuclease/phosphatase family protein [Sphingobacteriales bacterium]|nr:endonuclease/exonuclease/phosphatase family protein [Sphingobacteriales bacterium]
MPSKARRLTKHIFVITNIVTALLFVGACITPYFHSNKMWMLGVLTLGFPILFFILLAFLFFWLIVKPKRSLISLFALIIGWKTIGETIGFTFRGNKKTDASAYKIMSWNVHMFDFYNYKKDPAIKNKMFELAREEKPAIACFQEFAYTMPTRDSNYAIDEIARQLKMPYYFVQSHPLDSAKLKRISLHFGKAIFSRYPIINAQHVFKRKGTYNYSFQYADIVMPTDTVRVFNIHLQSLYFKNKEYEFVENFGDNDESLEDGSKNVLRKMRNGFNKRMEQSDTIANYIRQSPYPVIVCGDFNDVPGSYAYQKVRGSLQDAFVEKGLGFSRTFTRLSPTLRIDNIFASKQLQVEGYRRINRELSDHFPVIALLKPEDKK